MYSDGRGKLSDPLNKLIHEFQGFAPTTTEYISFQC